MDIMLVETLMRGKEKYHDVKRRKVARDVPLPGWAFFLWGESSLNDRTDLKKKLKKCREDVKMIRMKG